VSVCVHTCTSLPSRQALAEAEADWISTQPIAHSPPVAHCLSEPIRGVPRKHTHTHTHTVRSYYILIITLHTNILCFWLQMAFSACDNGEETEVKIPPQIFHLSLIFLMLSLFYSVLLSPSLCFSLCIWCCPCWVFPLLLLCPGRTGVGHNLSLSLSLHTDTHTHTQKPTHTQLSGPSWWPSGHEARSPPTTPPPPPSLFLSRRSFPLLLC